METFTGIVKSGVFALIPIGIYSTFVWWVTWKEKQLGWLVGFAVLWGALPAFAFVALVPFLFMYLGNSPIFHESNQIWLMSIVVPLLEEILKTLSILSIFAIYRHKNITPTEGLVYGSLVGLGFSMVEDFWYYLAALQSGGFSSISGVALVRGLLGGLNHSVYSGIAGAGLGLAFVTPRPWKWLLASSGFVIASFVHCLYNLTAFIADDISLGVYSVETRMLAMVVNATISALGVCLLLLIAICSWGEIKAILKQNVLPFASQKASREKIASVIDRPWPPMMPSSRDRVEDVVRLAIAQKIARYR